MLLLLISVSTQISKTQLLSSELPSSHPLSKPQPRRRLSGRLLTAQGSPGRELSGAGGEGWVTENKHSSADHTLHLHPSHWERGRRQACRFLIPVESRLTCFPPSRERRPRDAKGECPQTTTLEVTWSPGAAPPDANVGGARSWEAWVSSQCWGRVRAGGEEGNRMSRLDGITDSIDVSLSKHQETVKDREAWWATVPGVAKSRTRLE